MRSETTQELSIMTRLEKVVYRTIAIVCERHRRRDSLGFRCHDISGIGSLYAEQPSE
jgi:hypothetical protein